jgi:hypothetical protein
MLKAYLSRSRLHRIRTAPTAAPLARERVRTWVDGRNRPDSAAAVAGGSETVCCGAPMRQYRTSG